MLTLSELQQGVADWVLRGESSNQLSVAIKFNDILPEKRLTVYRNNTQLGLTEALREGYPVVNKLVGKDFFNRMAQDYIRQFPPKAACLLTFGGEFADFIFGYQHAASLAYLPDVARLEWLWHEAFHEADASPLDISLLTGLEPEFYGQLSFTFHPTIRLMASDYPVFAIWNSNQDDFSSEKGISLDEGGCRLLIFRPEWDVVIVALAPAEFTFLSALQQGATLTQAAECAFSIDSSINLLEVLQRGFGLGLFTGYSLSQDED